MSFLLNILITLLLSILKIICLLVAIAYFTLAERKIMAAVQRRVGPNVVGPFGLLQPLADGLKLAGKELAIPAQASSRIFLSVAITVLLFALSGWSAIPFGMFDHSEHMSNSSVAKILLLTEPSMAMYHTTLECYYAAPESRGFLCFWNTFEDFFKERGFELLSNNLSYDLLPAMLASKDPLRLLEIASSLFSPLTVDAVEAVRKMALDWFEAIPWTKDERWYLLQIIADECFDDEEFRRIVQRRILGLLHEPLFPDNDFWFFWKNFEFGPYTDAPKGLGGWVYVPKW